MSVSKSVRIEIEAMLAKWKAQGVGSAYADMTSFLLRHPHMPTEDEEHCEIQGCLNEPRYDA